MNRDEREWLTSALVVTGMCALVWAFAMALGGCDTLRSVKPSELVGASADIGLCVANALSKRDMKLVPEAQPAAADAGVSQ